MAERVFRMGGISTPPSNILFFRTNVQGGTYKLEIHLATKEVYTWTYDDKEELYNAFDLFSEEWDCAKQGIPNQKLAASKDKEKAERVKELLKTGYEDLGKDKEDNNNINETGILGLGTDLKL